MWKDRVWTLIGKKEPRDQRKLPLTIISGSIFTIHTSNEDPTVTKSEWVTWFDTLLKNFHLTMNLEDVQDVVS